MENKTAKACHENYIRRIEIVQDYIEEHMEEELKIVTLAKVAGFSEYHFSRIFVGVLGENIAQYVKRIRMIFLLLAMVVHRVRLFENRLFLKRI